MDHPSMIVRVELFGLARMVADTPHVDLSLDGEPTLRMVLAALVAAQPGLTGLVTLPDLSGLSPGYSASLDGLQFVDDPETRLRPGQTLLLFPSASGGLGLGSPMFPRE